MTYGNILGEFPTKFHVARIYLKRLDVTYVAITCIGFIYLCGPKTNDPTWVLRYNGDTSMDIIRKDECFTAALQEAAKVYKISYDARKEEES